MGVPAIYGLYASLVPLVIYAFFGSSRFLSIGPVAITAILLMQGISTLADPFTDEFISYAILAGLFIGVFQILLSILRLGFLINLISQPVLSGFISAAALIIIFSQLGELVGLELPKQDYAYEAIVYVFTHFKDINIITLGLSTGAFIFLILFRIWKKSFPAALLLIVITTIICYYFKLDTKGVSVVANVPEGLPKFALPEFEISRLKDLIPTILSVTFIGYVGSIGIAKGVEMKHKNQTVRPNQELFALGISKIIGAFFLAVPSSGSYSRTAINEEAGAKTSVSSLITALLVGLALLFLTSLFYYIPTVVLSVIIILSVVKLIDVKEAIRLYTIRRSEFMILIFTFLVTFFLGMEKGILTGVVLSFIFIIYHSSKPHLAELVNIPSTPYYRNIDRFPQAQKSEEYMILRFDDQLYFANANYFKDGILGFLKRRSNTPEFIILDTTNIHDIDSTGLKSLQDVVQYLTDHNIQLLLSGTIGPVRDFLKRTGFSNYLGADHFFLNITDAVEYAENHAIDPDKIKFANQVNSRRGFLD